MDIDLEVLGRHRLEHQCDETVSVPATGFDVAGAVGTAGTAGATAGTVQPTSVRYTVTN